MIEQFNCGTCEFWLNPRTHFTTLYILHRTFYIIHCTLYNCNTHIMLLWFSKFPAIPTFLYKPADSHVTTCSSALFQFCRFFMLCKPMWLEASCFYMLYLHPRTDSSACFHFHIPTRIILELALRHTIRFLSFGSWKSKILDFWL